jgi:DNA-binding CsgD family transcriptional regulator
MPATLLPSFAWEHLNTKLRLSPREAEIVQWLCADESEESIAYQLGISKHTVHSHLERLYKKIGVTSRAQVVIRLFREYMAQLPPTEAAFKPAPQPTNGSARIVTGRRLYQRVAREQLAGVVSVRIGGRNCDDLLVDLGPGGLRLRANRTVSPAAILRGATIVRRARRGRPVRVPIARLESSQCTEHGTDFLAHRAIFSRVLPASLCADLQSALGNGAGTQSLRN